MCAAQNVSPACEAALCSPDGPGTFTRMYWGYPKRRHWTHSRTGSLTVPTQRQGSFHSEL